MQTIVIANQKGGSGKSTATVHLAVAAEHAGDGPVIISDTDPQGTTVEWFISAKGPALKPRDTLLSLCLGCRTEYAPWQTRAHSICSSTPPLLSVA